MCRNASDGPPIPNCRLGNEVDILTYWFMHHDSPASVFGCTPLALLPLGHSCACARGRVVCAKCPNALCAKGREADSGDEKQAGMMRVLTRALGAARVTGAPSIEWSCNDGQ